MATEVVPGAGQVDEAMTGRSGPRLYKLTVEQYNKTLEAGVFADRSKVELLGGALVEKTTKTQAHDFGVCQLGELLRKLLPPQWCVREEKSMILDRWSCPEPDLLVCCGPHLLYRRTPPVSSDVPILIEVADIFYEKDRGIKLRRYAAAKIPAYWIVNIPPRRIEVFGDPAGKGKEAAYRNATLYDDQAEVPVVIDGVELGRIIVRDVLP